MNHDLNINDRLLTVRQVSEITGQAVATLNRARIYGTSNAPPFVKLGKSVRYKLSSVSRWIESQSEFTHTTAQQMAAQA